jgi:multidrug efflux pump subunit AcrA (membrane-fusion protein)
MKKYLFLFSSMAAFLWSCHPTDTAATSADAPVTTTPVAVTTIQFGPISDSIELNASSTYLQNSYVKSIATGFIKSVQIKPGDFVTIGKTLFTLETKESAAIGQTISSLDSSFKFSGLITVRAQGHGYITQLNHQLGDYVQDGEQLAVVSDQNSFVFLLNMPYEYRNIVLKNKTVFLTLPDNTRLTGSIGTVFPNVDSLTQTQAVTIRIQSPHTIPQNLIARVHILRYAKKQAQIVARSAVLSDDAQTSFWVMKMIDSSTAVKIPIQKGMEFPDKIEILDPSFKVSDQILISGNYGLPDTAKVSIQKP